MIQSTTEGSGDERRVYKVMRESCEYRNRQVMMEWRTNDIQSERNDDGTETKKGIQYRSIAVISYKMVVNRPSLIEVVPWPKQCM